MTRQKEEFKSLEDKKVRMYNCGPTVYNFIHVGNARPLVVFDTLRRYFIYKGYDVDFVVNFTDIDDKLINRAKDENTTVFDVADRYIGEFMQDANGLNLYTYETINPRATEFIEPMLKFVGASWKKARPIRRTATCTSTLPRPRITASSPAKTSTSCKAAPASKSTVPRKTPATSSCGRAKGRRTLLGQPLGRRPPRLALGMLRHGQDSAR